LRSGRSVDLFLFALALFGDGLLGDGSLRDGLFNNDILLLEVFMGDSLETGENVSKEASELFIVSRVRLFHVHIHLRLGGLEVFDLNFERKISTVDNGLDITTLLGGIDDVVNDLVSDIVVDDLSDGVILGDSSDLGVMLGIGIGDLFGSVVVDGLKVLKSEGLLVLNGIDDLLLNGNVGGGNDGLNLGGLILLGGVDILLLDGEVGTLDLLETIGDLVNDSIAVLAGARIGAVRARACGIAVLTAVLSAVFTAHLLGIAVVTVAGGIKLKG